MKTFRVVMSIHIRGTDPSQAHEFEAPLPVFYVYSVSAATAITGAIRIASASASPCDEYRSAGAVVPVDSGLNPTGDPVTWDDIGDAPHATVYRARVAGLVRKVVESCESLSLDNPTDRKILVRHLMEALT